MPLTAERKYQCCCYVSKWLVVRRSSPSSLITTTFCWVQWIEFSRSLPSCTDSLLVIALEVFQCTSLEWLGCSHTHTHSTFQEQWQQLPVRLCVSVWASLCPEHVNALLVSICCLGCYYLLLISPHTPHTLGYLQKTPLKHACVVKQNNPHLRVCEILVRY